ncbi:hypothetical protein NMY22_g13149 [Coprinellus aureogranulatus]|nr:hypothetical protein NMY22_g13149 [Coprinellus aureogranulatus]
MTSINFSIDILPQELLEKIFLECVPRPTRDTPGPVVSRHHPVVVLSRVCHEWRVFSLNNPLLWRCMHIRLPSTEEFPKFREWCNAVGDVARLIATWIERSAPCLITVMLDLQIPSFNLGDRFGKVVPSPHDCVRIPLSTFRGCKRWEEVSISITCDGALSPLMTFLRICKEYPSADSFPNLKVLSIQITANNATPDILHIHSASLLQTGLFSAPLLRRITIKGHCRINNSSSFKQWSRGCRLLTEICIDSPDVNSRPVLFDPSDALCLLEALPSLTKASFGLQNSREAGQTVAFPAQVTAPKLVSLSLHGIPAGPEFARVLILPSLSKLNLLFYPYSARVGLGSRPTSPPEGYAEGILELLRIFGRQLEGVALNPGPFAGTRLSFDPCLEYLDNERLESLSIIHSHFPERRRQAVNGVDSHKLDLVLDRLNDAALKFITKPSVFPNMKVYRMNVYNACTGDACSRALLEIIASRRGRVEDTMESGDNGTVSELGNGVLRPEDVGTPGLVHGRRRSHLQDVHLSFSMPSPIDLVRELSERRTDLRFNLRLEYPHSTC